MFFISINIFRQFHGDTFAAATRHALLRHRLTNALAP
jgi:hypothetical protein